MNEGSSKRDDLLSDTERATLSQRRRVSEVRARQHIGAAGWQQNATLEGILRAGREGLNATDTLRQVISLTTEQIRTLPLSDMSGQDDYLQALQAIVRNGEEQLTAAQALDEVVCQALEDVSNTPLDEVSVLRLRNIQDRMQEQVGALMTIIKSAQVQAQTLEQVSRLEEISAEHQQRVLDIRHFSAGEEADALGETGQQVVERIAELDEAHTNQLEALEKIGHSVVKSVPETGAETTAQAATLEKIAETAQQKAEELRGSEKEGAKA